jgi:hypothetical protein
MLGDLDNRQHPAPPRAGASAKCAAGSHVPAAGLVSLGPTEEPTSYARPPRYCRYRRSP